jgi:hypothetical protein
MLNVLEVGPGLNPSKYAYNSDVNYIGIDPDMHYLVSVSYDLLHAHIKKQRKDMTNFTYKRGVLLGDVVEELAVSQDVVVMANVLGDSNSYRKNFSGYYVDPDSGITKQTDIIKSNDLIIQALTCTKQNGTLIVIEDAVRHRTEIDHKTPEEFKSLIEADIAIKGLISAYSIFHGDGYRNKIAALYQETTNEPIDGYFDNFFVAELERR